MTLKAVSFDLWDTLIRDDSDEPKRQAQGLPSKRVARRQLVWEALSTAEPVPRREVDLAYDTADAAFNKVWHEGHVTWPIAERLEVLLAGLDRTLPDPAFAALVRAHEEMEVELPPDPVEGTAEALAELAGQFRLCVVSDAIVSPGRALRRLLARHGLEDFFEAFAFSDEVGRSKPDAAMFRHVADRLGVAFEEMVHVGDREANDVAGPQALGMRAILFTGSRDRGSATSRADAVVARMADLARAVRHLNRES